MSSARDKFRELTRVFDPIYQPRQDAADGPGTSYVAETHGEYRRQLEGILELNDNGKLLVAGQPGCGKTTLLLNVAQTLRKEGRIVAFVDLEAQTTVLDLDSVEMHMAALAELLSEAHKSGAALSKDTLSTCQAWLRPLQPQSPIDPAIPSILAALKRQLSLVRDNSSLRTEMRDMAQKETEQKDELYTFLSRALRDLEDRRPVVILDGLDKVPPERARPTFLGRKMKPLAETPGAAVITVPLSIVYEPRFNVLSERYNNADTAVLPAVRLWDFDAQGKKTRSEEGVSVLRKIISTRVDPIDPNLVLPDAVERAIVGSGGNIRDLARLLQNAVVKAFVRRGDFIETMDVEAAIADRRESFRRAFDPKFLPILQRVRAESRLDESSELAQQLLYGLWVMEYRNGSAWYSLPEPVEQLLRHMERSAQ